MTFSVVSYIEVLLFLGLRLCPPLGLLRRPWPTSWTYPEECWFCFFSAVSALLKCLPSGLVVSSFCWSINWTHHIISYHWTDGTRKQQPYPLGARPAPRAPVCFVSFFIIFLFFSVSFHFALIFVFFFGCTYVCYSLYHRYVHGIISLQVIRDGTSIRTASRYS